jgi:hypothetical protein
MLRPGKAARGSRFQAAGQTRLHDALALRRAAQGFGGVRSEPDRWVGAAYLAGIALECQTKWVLCERRRRTHVDEIDEALIRAAGHDLERCLRECGLLRAVREQHPAEWEAATGWRIDWRYNPPGTPTARECERFVEVAQFLFQWLREQIT